MTEPNRMRPRTVHKYVCTERCNVFQTPARRRPIHVDFDTYSHDVAVWFEVEADEKLYPTTVWLVPTGGEVPPTTEYIGSLQRNEVIFHLYWRVGTP